MVSNINFLKIPLHKLYYIEDLNSFTGLVNDELDSLKNEYDESEIKEIVKSVVWAKQNPNYDFSSLLPDLQYDNDEIYKYLCKIEVSLSRL